MKIIIFCNNSALFSLNRRKNSHSMLCFVLGNAKKPLPFTLMLTISSVSEHLGLRKFLYELYSCKTGETSFSVYYYFFLLRTSALGCWILSVFFLLAFINNQNYTLFIIIIERATNELSNTKAEISNIPTMLPSHTKHTHHNQMSTIWPKVLIKAEHKLVSGNRLKSLHVG